MNMVINAANQNWFEIVLSCDSREVGPNAVFQRWCNPTLAIFGAENRVVVEAGVGVGHGDSSVTTRRGASRSFVRGLKPTATIESSLRDCTSAIPCRCNKPFAPRSGEVTVAEDFNPRKACEQITPRHKVALDFHFIA